MYITHTNKPIIDSADEPPHTKGTTQTEKQRRKTIPYRLLLRKELDKEYNQENFLDRFDLAKTMDVSAIIPTYQRCPYNPKTPEGKLNPLTWCLESLLAQRPKLSEIVIVSDASRDYTDAVVRIYRKKAREKNIRLVYIKNEARLGSSKSRNIGVEKATSNFVFFMDDDCITKKYSIFGAFYTLQKLSETGSKVGAVVLGVYQRLPYPSEVIRGSEIGMLHLAKGEYASNFEKFPRRYLRDEDIFLNEEYKIYKPFQIQNLIGVFLAPRKRILAVGGFPTFFTWKNAYGEESEIGCKLMANGYGLFFCPDMKFGLYHGKFGEGAPIPMNRYFLNKYNNTKLVDNLTLQELNQECSKPRLDTGNRVSVEDWYYSKIISFFVIMYPRNRMGALNWARSTYHQFVEENDIERFGGGKYTKIAEKKKREKIWFNAVKDGLNLVTAEEQQERRDFMRGLRSMRRFNFLFKLRNLILPDGMLFRSLGER